MAKPPSRYAGVKRPSMIAKGSNDFPNENMIIGKEYQVEKTADIFKEVVFKYGEDTWDGAIPKFLENQGVEFSDEELSDIIPQFYEDLDPSKKDDWIAASNRLWEYKNGKKIKKKKKDNDTYKVLKALYSGKWECRKHGKAAKKNPQAAARISALKKKGYVIASKRKECEVCGKKTMHDVLVMIRAFDTRFDDGNELRKPMSEKLKTKIKKVLGLTDACFGVKRTEKQLIIDHKFPSQRWSKPESDNPDDMTDGQIRAKFQLLSNQNNMWKSRYCDRCVKEGIRGDFMGMSWYYEGTDQWTKAKDDEQGCVGCPWYDTAEWKTRLIETSKTSSQEHP